MSKRDEKIVAEAKRRLLDLIEEALEADTDEVSEFEVRREADSIAVDMASDIACYVPLVITVYHARAEHPARP